MEKMKTFWNRVELMYKEPKTNYLRIGQVMMIILRDLDANLYSEITEKGDCDPFYVDSKIPAFMNVLTEAWAD